MARKPEILTISEFLGLKGKQKKPVIVYFDKNQWAKLTRGLKPIDQKPPRNNNALTLTLTSLPGVDGGFVEIRCPVGGPITGAEGELRCGGKPNVDFPEPSTEPQIREGCFKILKKDGSIRCAGACSRPGKRCRLASYTVPAGISGLRLVVTSCHCG